jgi:hypothetical protein
MFRKHRIRKIVLVAIPLFASVAFAGDSAIDRWANAVGGRERISAIQIDLPRGHDRICRHAGDD